jgi:hypothetical protein
MFCLEKPARYQLMTQRTVPGFDPSAPATELAETTFDTWRRALREAGVTDRNEVDILTAVVQASSTSRSRWTRRETASSATLTS